MRQRSEATSARSECMSDFSSPSQRLLIRFVGQSRRASRAAMRESGFQALRSLRRHTSFPASSHGDPSRSPRRVCLARCARRSGERDRRRSTASLRIRRALFGRRALGPLHRDRARLLGRSASRSSGGLTFSPSGRRGRASPPMLSALRFAFAAFGRRSSSSRRPRLTALSVRSSPMPALLFGVRTGRSAVALFRRHRRALRAVSLAGRRHDRGRRRVRRAFRAD